MKSTLIIILSVALSISGVFFLQNSGVNVGAITTILGTDKLSSSRTTINDNFTDLDTTKMEMSTTSVASITTLTGLVTTGTIGTGVWQGTVIATAFGGTATTSWSTANTILYASSTNAMLGVPIGTVGQVLGLVDDTGDAGLVPKWVTTSVNQADTFDWTGLHTWTASTTFSVGSEAAAIFNGLLMFKGTGTTTLDFSGTATNSASSTVMSQDADGKISHVPLSRLLVAEATTTAVTANASTTVFAHTIPANMLGSRAVLSGRLELTMATISDADDGFELTIEYGGLMIATSSARDLTGTFPTLGTIEFHMIWDGTSQFGGYIFSGQGGTDWDEDSTAMAIAESATQAVDTTVDQLFQVVMRKAGSTGDFTFKHGYLKLEI